MKGAFCGDFTILVGVKSSGMVFCLRVQSGGALPLSILLVVRADQCMVAVVFRRGFAVAAAFFW